MFKGGKKMKKLFIIPFLILLGVCIFDYNSQAQSSDQESKVRRLSLHYLPRQPCGYEGKYHNENQY